jgi:hypothetical protein
LDKSAIANFLSDMSSYGPRNNAGYPQRPTSGYPQPGPPAAGAGYPQPPTSAGSGYPKSAAPVGYPQPPPAGGYSQPQQAGYPQQASHPAGGYSQAQQAGYSQPAGGYSQQSQAGYPQQASQPAGGYSQPQQAGHSHPAGGYSQAAPGYAQPGQQPAGGFPGVSSSAPQGMNRVVPPPIQPSSFAAPFPVEEMGNQGPQNFPSYDRNKVQPPMGGGSGQSTPPGADWFSQTGFAQAVTTAAVSAAVSGGDPARMFGGLAENVEKTSQSWFASRLNYFRDYFNVTHSYVRWKLLYVLLPFIPMASSGVSRTVSREIPYEGEDKTEQSGSGVGLRLMPGRRPDLYLPLMGYITFIIIYAFSKGDAFHPDDLYNIASLAGVLGLLEVLAIKGTAYIVSLPTLTLTDIVAVCGYKFINLSLSVLSLILMGPGATSTTVWSILWLWAAAMAGLTVQKGLVAAIQYNSNVNQYMGTGSGNMEKLLSLVAGGSQVFWCWILMPSVSAVAPGRAARRRVMPVTNGVAEVGRIESTGA